MSIITEIQGLPSEVVIIERQTTSDFKIESIRENIAGRFVDVEVELGPFAENPSGVVAGSGRRSVRIWTNEEYDAIRDSWTNADLIDAVKNKLI